MNTQGLKAKQAILSALLELDAPSTLTEISEKAGFFAQRVGYHMPNLIRIGMITRQEVDGQKLYALQEIQYSNQRGDELENALASIYDTMLDTLDFSQAEVEPLISVANNMNLLIEALLTEIAVAHGFEIQSD